MKNNEINIKKIDIIILIISSILIVMFHKLNITWHLKNIIIPMIIILLSYIVILSNRCINKKAYYLLIPISLILISNFIVPIDHRNESLNIIILPILVTTFIFLLINKNFNFSNDWMSWIFKVFPKGLFNNLKYLKIKNKEDNNKVTNVLLGVFIGGFIGFILLSLLMSADDYFQAFIENIITVPNFGFGDLISISIYFIILFSVLVNFILNKSSKLKKIKQYDLDSTMITTILAIINVVFVLFLISEISRITTNFLRLPIEYTYSSYAREGFFQLLFVTIINFSVIMFLLYKSNIIFDKKTIKNLILTLIIFSVILIFNSYYRMFLYINHYGFTVLRLQVILFLAMELTLFIFLSVKILKNLKFKDSIVYFVIVISFYIINLYLCNDAFIQLI